MADGIILAMLRSGVLSIRRKPLSKGNSTKAAATR
jgi:hypothetical protein